MQTVITWTRYDGTPKTLPPFDTNVLGRLVDTTNVCPLRLDICGWRGTVSWGIVPRIGDLWAPWPAAPQGVE